MCCLGCRPSDSALNRLIGELESFPNVTRVVADTRWMARLEETLVAGERWVLALGGAMVLGAILALANTLHLAIDARREEILVVRVIGGSPAFVRRPFLYTGLYFGVRRRGVSSAHAVGFEPLAHRAGQRPVPVVRQSRAASGSGLRVSIGAHRVGCHDRVVGLLGGG